MAESKAAATTERVIDRYLAACNESDADARLHSTTDGREPEPVGWEEFEATTEMIEGDSHVLVEVGVHADGNAHPGVLLRGYGHRFFLSLRGYRLRARRTGAADGTVMGPLSAGSYEVTATRPERDDGPPWPADGSLRRHRRPYEIRVRPSNQSQRNRSSPTPSRAT